jgi:hypothetical protein
MKYTPSATHRVERLHASERQQGPDCDPKHKREIGDGDDSDEQLKVPAERSEDERC